MRDKEKRKQEQLGSPWLKDRKPKEEDTWTEDKKKRRLSKECFWL